MRRHTVCDLCGAVVRRDDAHAAWHDRLDASVRLAAAGFARRSEEVFRDLTTSEEKRNGSWEGFGQ